MVFKIVQVILLASVKYLLTIPYARLIGLSYEQALVAVLLGGIGGFLFFFYLNGWVNLRFKKIVPFICKQFPPYIQAKYKGFCENRKNKTRRKIFSRTSRFIVSMRKNYGFWGIVISTPIFLTIPLGAFLANKYYGRKKHVVTYMILSIIGWAFILTSLIHIFPGVAR